MAAGIRLSIPAAISIHAPREGCDDFSTAPWTLNLLFQSTHPVRGATIEAASSLNEVQFQSTHPVRGATLTITVSAMRLAISIHAPREGCDMVASVV